MRHLTRTIALATLTTATLVGTASGAHALSLGPAGTKLSGQGMIGNAGSLYNGYTFDGIAVDCKPTATTTTLDGSASATLSTTYTSCVSKETYTGPPGGPVGPATVTAPGGHVVTLKSVVKQEDGTYTGRGQLSSGAKGVVVTVGSCTLTIPPNVDFLTSAGTVQISSGGVVLAQPILRNPLNPYSGSSGCPATLRGQHTRGAGLSFWTASLKGLKPTP